MEVIKMIKCCRIYIEIATDNYKTLLWKLLNMPSETGPIYINNIYVTTLTTTVF